MQGIAMVHQHFSLVPDLSVVDNLLLGQARGTAIRVGGRRRLDHAAVPFDPARWQRGRELLHACLGDLGLQSDGLHHVFVE